MKLAHAIAMSVVGTLFGVLPAAWLIMHTDPGSPVRQLAVALMVAGIGASAPVLSKML